MSERDELVAEIHAAGGQARALVLDVTDAASVAACFDAIEAEIGAPDVVISNAGTTVTAPLLELTEADWAPSRIRLGLELYSNFADASSYSLVAMHVANWLNPWGAELRSVARIGSARGLNTEFYQPLGPGSRWFASAKLSYEAGANDVFSQGQRALRLSSSLTSAQLELGHRVAGLGDLRFGVGQLRASDEIVLPVIPEQGPQSKSYSQSYLELQPLLV